MVEWAFAQWASGRPLAPIPRCGVTVAAVVEGRIGRSTRGGRAGDAGHAVGAPVAAVVERSCRGGARERGCAAALGCAAAIGVGRRGAIGACSGRCELGGASGLEGGAAVLVAAGGGGPLLTGTAWLAKAFVIAPSSTPLPSALIPIGAGSKWSPVLVAQRSLSLRRSRSWGLRAAVGIRPAPPPPPPPTALGAFTDVTEAAGVAFEYENGALPEQQYYLVELAGAGGALFDFDGDGDLDLYAVQGHPFDEDAGAGGAPSRDRLFRNELAESGELRFTDVTEDSGIVATGYGMGAAVGDIDNDGYPDLYVLNWGPNQLWRNNGDGTFSDISEVSGTADPGWSTGASFADLDRDGFLDLMVVNYNAFSIATHRPGEFNWWLQQRARV